MDNASFKVRHDATGLPADDLVVGISEARAAISVTDANILALITGGAWLATASSTNLADKSHAINTTGKVKGKLVHNTTTDLIVFALGSADTSKWRLTGAVDSTGDVTPS